MRSGLSAFAFAALVAVFVAAPVSAAEKPAPCDAAERRLLDFWIGDWDAFDVGDKVPSGRARIDPILGGCALHERYEGADGHRGESLTVYDAGRGLWHQTWVTDRGRLLTIEGRFAGGALTMEGPQYADDGRRDVIRGTWKREGRGVRETAAISEGGGAWRPLFDILFLPKREGGTMTGSADAVGDTAETISRLNQQYIDAFLASDVEWYRAHLADDFVCIESDGTVLDREAFLRDAAKPTAVSAYHLADVRVRVLGDTALVHATGAYTRRDGTTGRNRYTDVYERTPAGWKAVSAQITPVR